MKPVALITGGSRGIGYGIAVSLAREGYELALCGRRSALDVAEALEALEMYGIKVRYFVADISDSDARGKLIDQTKEAFGRLNVLVNNAGVAPRERRDILEATEDSFERVMRINVQGPYFLTQLAARWMVEQSRADESFSGSIVTVTSISSTVASPSRGEYCMSKAALSMSSQLWAVRLAEFGISVYEVRPGVIRTDMTRAVESIYDEKIAQGLTLQPRWGEPADVGKAVAMLVRGDLPYSTGQVIMVDGGLTVPRL